MPTTTASSEKSLDEGTRMVLRISLPTSKSNASNNPPARRNLIVSFSWVCSLGDLRNILKNQSVQLHRYCNDYPGGNIYTKC